MLVRPILHAREPGKHSTFTHWWRNQSRLFRLRPKGITYCSGTNLPGTRWSVAARGGYCCTGGAINPIPACRPEPGHFCQAARLPSKHPALGAHPSGLQHTGSIHGVARARAGVLITAQIAALGVRAASYSPRVRICPAGSGVPTPCPSCGTFNEPAEPLGRDTVHAAQPRKRTLPGSVTTHGTY